MDALDEALARFGQPELFNTDQGSQFTSAAFPGRLASAGVRISLDGRSRWMDNVLIERLWRSLTHEEVYLKGDAPTAARQVPASPWGSAFTMDDVHIRRWPAEPRWRCGVTASAALSPTPPRT